MFPSLGLRTSTPPNARIRRYIAYSLAIASAMIGVDNSTAQSTSPAKPVRVVVPFGAGTGLDVAARALSSQLAVQMKVPMPVENREGAGGAIGSTVVQSAPPDGSTLLIAVNPPFVVQPMLMKSAGYDPAKGFTPIAKVATVDLALVAGKDAPFSTFDEFVNYVRKNPGKVTYAYPGTGTGSFLDMERIRSALNLDMLGVAYKSAGQAMTDVIGGQVSVWLPSLPAALPFVPNGQLKVLAIGSPHRLPVLPNVPTLAEATKQPGFQSTVWYGVFGPAGMKRDMVERLNKEIGAAMATPAVKEILEKSSITPTMTTADEFAKEVAANNGDSRALVDRLGLKPE